MENKKIYLQLHNSPDEILNFLSQMKECAKSAPSDRQFMADMVDDISAMVKLVIASMEMIKPEDIPMKLPKPITPKGKIVS